jgi:hypothetical protein
MFVVFEIGLRLPLAKPILATDNVVHKARGRQSRLDGLPEKACFAGNERFTGREIWRVYQVPAKRRLFQQAR